MAQDNEKKVVAGLGELLWDVFPTGKKIGGAPANFAFHAQSLGCKSYVVSSIGDDDLGREILSELDSRGLDQTYVHIDSEHPTGRVDISLDAEGKMTAPVIHEGVAWDFIPLTPEAKALAESVDAVCYGTLAQRSPVSKENIQGFLKATRNECIRLYDVNLRVEYYSADLVDAMMSLATVLKVSDDEMPVIAKLLNLPDTENEFLKALMDKYPLELIALTKGGAGSHLISREGESLHAGFPTEVADTVGAGDSFNAGVVTGLMNGNSLDEINDKANRLASFVCSNEGAMPHLTDQLLKQIA